METMKKRFIPVILAVLVGVGIIIGRLSAPTSSAPVQAAGTGAPAATASNTSGAISTSAIDAATEAAYAAASKSVVYVVSAGVGSGSGVIYDNKGDIVTNNHVVTGATSLSVTLNNGKTYAAHVVGTDAADDLAVIKINASGLSPAHFAAAGQYNVAQTVLAVGSPLGLKQSVSSGLISGLHRVEQEGNGAYIANAIQTSAAINPGNSGGALVTLNGTVVGMPTLVQTSDTSGTSVEGIGFAIPSERITFIANQIIAHGKVQHTGRPFLGIVPTDSQGQAGFSFGFGGSQQQQGSVPGALVSRVGSSSPAGKAGLQQGDVITSADGQTITDAQDLLTVLAQEKPGNSVSLKVNRNGQTMSFTVKLGELPA
jgi:putative serine protease PepD